MKFIYFKSFLIVLLISFIGCIPVILLEIYYYVKGRSFMRRITVLEQLLDSKLRCTFSIFLSGVKICGTYRGSSITFSSFMYHYARYSDFKLKPVKVPSQKMLLIRYPKLSENVQQRGKWLVYSIRGDFLSESKILSKAEAIRILDELVDTAERCEERIGNQWGQPWK